MNAGKSNLARHINQMDVYQAQRTMKRSGQAGRPPTAILINIRLSNRKFNLPKSSANQNYTQGLLLQLLDEFHHMNSSEFRLKAHL